MGSAHGMVGYPGETVDMGTCHVLISPKLVDKLKAESDKLRVYVWDVKDHDDGRVQALLSSPLLSGGYHGMQAIIVEDGKPVRFKAEGVYHEDS